MNNTHDVNWGNTHCILPTNYMTDGYDNGNLNKRIAVVIHLHYSDTFDKYKEYCENIPEEITIYFTTSNEELNRKIENFSLYRENCKLIAKNNRGRDISSFLVACRKEILNHEYICFLHDKKEKNPSSKLDVDKWIYSQWENMLSSKNYIYNVISYFNKNDQLGLLLPPVPASERINFAYMNNWKSNYENTIKLAQDLNLQCDINKEVSPMAIGTVFWARVDALRKLFEHEWKYEDFDVEPLADDGTLSHAVERILEFAAKDSGYECKWVMTESYAEERLGYFTLALSKAFDRLRSSLGLRYIYDLDEFDTKSLELKKLYREHKKTYIYGAGILGTECLRSMDFIGVKIDGFIVTDMSGNESVIENIPVHAFGEIEFDSDTLVIIATNKKYQEEILKNFKKNQLTSHSFYNWCSH
ncbi:rhamnan synthesis F family protein [Paenibacillus xylanexedens]|uniref:rhamnan synthesis F family protein n=1 Tax=Paenibacillus xylanexedens TaxID=528191 RepID=UPI001642A4F2|nr:rhamnan synthesis F family protein [Paenibacillus xylanexedens]